MYRTASRMTSQPVESEQRALTFGAKGLIILTILSLASNNIFELQEVVILPWFYLSVLVVQMHRSTVTSGAASLHG